MDSGSVIKSTQEQASAAWIDYLNQLRLSALVEKLSAQDGNLERALEELSKAKTTIAEEIIARNRGGTKGMHGFIAEVMESGFGNAGKLVLGEHPEYVWINDNGPVDMFQNGVPIQQKFVQKNFSLNAIQDHLEKHPEYLKKGGVYQIPKDFYEKVKALHEATWESVKNAPNKDAEVWFNSDNKKTIEIFLKDSGVRFEDLEPAEISYKDAQRDNVDQSFGRKESEIHGTDQQKRSEAYQASKPTIKEGVSATAASAALEGGVAFCLAVARKRKTGKRFHEFTTADWREIGIDTAKGTAVGGIRGSAIYVMSNFTATPAAVASAFVTASVGIAAQARLLWQGKVTAEDFIINAETLCLDVTVSALSALLGQVAIPIPVLGAIVGNAVGTILSGIVKEYLSEQEQRLIKEFTSDMDMLNQRLDKQYQELLGKLKAEFAKFASIIEFAFSENVNLAFEKSMELADFSGVNLESVLRNKEDIDRFFTE